MKLTYVSVCGFRGYREEARLDFAPGFNVIDGRNGVGKSTIFDAVEFALTGDLSKYAGATASGQSVADYVWWIGEGDAPIDRYVEVGFSGDQGDWVIRRTPLDSKTFVVPADLTAALAHPDLAPEAPLKQLCATTIIRDEHIAGLSLDLKETERYALLRQAIGATDAETWINRAQAIVGHAKRRREAAQMEVTKLSNDVSSAATRIDELRLSLASSQAIAEATDRLRAFVDAPAASADTLVGTARRRIAAVELELQTLASLREQFPQYELARANLPELERQLAPATIAVRGAQERLEGFGTVEQISRSSELATQARSLITLIREGRKIGLIEHHCPLCAAGHSDESFAAGTLEAEAVASRIDEIAAGLAVREDEIATARATLIERQERERSLTVRLSGLQATIARFEEKVEGLALTRDANREALDRRTAELRSLLEAAQRDLRVLETLRLNDELSRATQAETVSKQRLQKGHERFGRTRKAEAVATAIYDAARRAAAETLDLRIDRVLPLMAELYSRLKPHPVWQDIDYSIRGDVRRFLSLKVGDGLNPQFLFSSGQRRATGLAFLLSINLSLAWSRWQSVLLDDPVQHVDDFRTVHLAEVLAQLVASGKQIICAVEDPALADMMCRRLPIENVGAAKRITLGPAANGSLQVQAAEILTPLPRRAFNEGPQALVG
jgi:chromosome segregation protein